MTMNRKAYSNKSMKIESNNQSDLSETNIYKPPSLKVVPKYRELSSCDLQTAAERIIGSWHDKALRENIIPEEVAGLINELHDRLVGINTEYEATGAGFALKIGKLLLIVQKKMGKGWKPWAYQHIKCRSEQTLRSYILIAGVNNVEKYLHFGMTRLLKIIRALDPKQKKTDDPIGDFLKKHHIHIDLNEEPPFRQLNLQISLAVAMEKVNKAGLNISRNKIKALLEMGIKFKDEFIEDALRLQKYGKDVDAYFKDVIGSGGGRPSYMKKAKKNKDIRCLIAEISQVIMEVITENIEIEGTYPEDVTHLIKLLGKFKEYLEEI